MIKTILIFALLSSVVFGQSNMVNGKGGGITDPTAFKTALALENVDNTSDANKPVSTATQTSLDLKSAIDSVQLSSFTAANDRTYTAVATLTVTDPAPVEGKGFIVAVRNGTATIGGVAYTAAGTVIRRSFHSGAWANYSYQDESAYAAAVHTHVSADVTDIPLSELTLAVNETASPITVAPFGSAGTITKVRTVTVPAGGTAGYTIIQPTFVIDPPYPNPSEIIGPYWVHNRHSSSITAFGVSVPSNCSLFARLSDDGSTFITTIVKGSGGTVALTSDINNANIVSAIGTDPDAIRGAIKIPSLQGFGIVSPETVSIAITNTGNNVTLTIAPISPATTFDVYAGPTAKYVTLTGSQTKTITGATSTNYFFYYENVAGTMTLQASTTAWQIGLHAPICYLTWDATAQSAVFKLWEVHSTAMDDATHAYNHTTSGAKYVINSGLNLIHNATTGTPASSGLNTMVGITPGKIRDEDIEVLTVNGTSGTLKWEQDHGPQTVGSVALANGGVFPVTYYNGTRAVTTTSNGRFPFLFTTNIPNYVNASGAITPVTEDQRFGYWLLITSDLDDPIRLMPHRAVYTSLSNAQAGMALTSLPADLQGIQATEVLCANRLIFRYNASGAGSSGSTAIKNTQLENVTDFRASQVALITGTAPNAASAVVVVPAGGIASTNVQSALEELDSEKASLADANTFLGQLKAPNQVAAATDDLMTRALADARYGSLQTAFRISDGSKASDTTLADDDVCFHDLAIGVYEIEFATFFECSGGTSGSKMSLAFTGVSDATKTGGIIETATGANSVVSSTFGATRPATGGGSTFTFPRSIVANNNVFKMARGKFIMHVTTAGRLSVQWAQNSSTATATLFYRSSFLNATRKP